MRLIREGKLQEYILYSLGEITLLVIGILIALQVNNMNAKSKVDDQVRSTLLALEKDLSQNIKGAFSLLAWNDRKDSLINEVLEKKVTKEMYHEGKLSSLHVSYNKAPVIDENLNKFLQYEDHLGEEYSELLKELKSYKSSIIGEKEVNQLFSDYTLEQGKHLTNNYPWFYDFMRGEVPEEAIDYFMNNPFYFNRLSFYQALMVDNQSSHVARRRNNEVILISLIEKILTKEGQQSLKKVLDDNGFKSCSLMNCNDSIPIDTTYQSFTNTLIKNNLQDTISLKFWNNKNEPRGKIRLAPGTKFNQQLPNECIIDYQVDDSCYQRYKAGANTYLIIE